MGCCILRRSRLEVLLLGPELIQAGRTLPDRTLGRAIPHGSCLAQSAKGPKANSNIGETRTQEEAQREERAAAERMIRAQAEAAQAKQRVAQLAALTGTEAELPPSTDGQVKILWLPLPFTELIPGRTALLAVILDYLDPCSVAVSCVDCA